MSEELNSDDKALKILRSYHKLKLKNEERRKLHDKCIEYVNGWRDGKKTQWSKETLGLLGDRPALSLNKVKKYANRICGAQRAAKMDDKCYPRDDESDWMTAEILSDLVKFVKDNTGAEREKSASFREGIIGTLGGYVKVEWSDEYDPLGDIVVKRVNPKRVYLLGEGERFDLMDYQGIIEEIPMDWDQLLEFAPDKKDELEGLSREYSDETPFSGGNDYEPPDGVEAGDVYDKSDDKYIVLRCQKYEYVPVTFFKNNDTGELNRAPDDPEQKRIATELIVASGINFKEVAKKIKKIRVTYTCGHVLLKDDFSPYEHGRFDIIRYAPYLDGGMTTGVIEDLLDPQDEVNKRRSQLIHILNTSPKNSWWIKEGAVSDIDDVRDRLALGGQLFEVKGASNLADIMRPIESNYQAIPALANLEGSSDQDMKDISGLTDASLGIVPEGVKSGRGIQQLQLPTETIIGEIFDNYVEFSKLIAFQIVELLQQYYTSERRVRILGDYQSKYLPENAQMQQMIQQGLVGFEDGAKFITINKQTLEGKLNDISVGKYDVITDVVAYNVTMRRAQYMSLMNAKSIGAPIKWSTIFRHSDDRGHMEMVKDALEAEAFMAAQMGAPPQLTPSPQQPNVAEGDLLGNSAGARLG